MARQPVTFDAATRVLRIGEHRVAVPADHDNESVLRDYLHLVAEARGRVVRSAAELRHDDVVALAELLDLDDDDLEARFVRLLGISRTEATDLRRRLHARRAVAAASVVAGLLVTAGVAHAETDNPSKPAAVVTAVAPATTSVPPTTQATAAASAPTPTTAAAPPAAEHAAPAPAEHTTRKSQPAEATPPSTVPYGSMDIGNAEVITKGTPSDDPNVDIGDSVTYGR